MRILSVAFALLFTVTSFAATAPTHNSSTTASHGTTVSHNTTDPVPAGTNKANPFIQQSVDASQISAAVSAEGDESAQNMKSIVSDATGRLDLMSEQLFTGLQQSDLQSVMMAIFQMNMMLSEVSDKMETASEHVGTAPSNMPFLHN